MTGGPDWLAPASLEEALEHKAQLGEEATVLAGGTFLGILMNQGFLRPQTLLSLGAIAGLDAIRRERDVLALGPMVRHRAVETAPLVHQHAPALAHAFKEFGTVDFRHLHVGDHDVDVLFFQHGPAGRGAARDQHLVVFAAEQAAQRGEDVRLVVDAQDRGRGRIRARGGG